MVIDPLLAEKHPDSVVIRDVPWSFYKALLRECHGRPSRINYDRGTLEIMTLSIEHERFKTLLGEMVSALARFSRVRIARGGSATLKRFAKKKGLEADQCYWIANAASISTKARINLKVDPPPDLVIEIDVMHAVVNRTDIYRSLGVPELWVLKRKSGLTAYRLDKRKWQPLERSLSFPFLTVADLNPFVTRVGVDDENDVMDDFSAWVRTLRP